MGENCWECDTKSFKWFWLVLFGTRPFNTMMTWTQLKWSTQCQKTYSNRTVSRVMCVHSSSHSTHTQFKHYQNEVVKVFHFRNFYRYFKWLGNKNYSKLDRLSTCFLHCCTQPAQWTWRIRICVDESIGGGCLKKGKQLTNLQVLKFLATTKKYQIVVSRLLSLFTKHCFSFSHVYSFYIIILYAQANTYTDTHSAYLYKCKPMHSPFLLKQRSVSETL